MALKHLHSGIKIVKIASYLAAGMLNKGYSAILTAMQQLQLKIGQQCKMFADNVDKQWIEKENIRASLSSKEARTAPRFDQLHKNQYYEEAEGLLYGAGLAE